MDRKAVPKGSKHAFCCSRRVDLCHQAGGNRGGLNFFSGTQCFERSIAVDDFTVVTRGRSAHDNSRTTIACNSTRHVLSRTASGHWRLLRMPRTALASLSCCVDGLSRASLKTNRAKAESWTPDQVRGDAGGDIGGRRCLGTATLPSPPLPCHQASAGNHTDRCDSGRRTCRLTRDWISVVRDGGGKVRS